MQEVEPKIEGVQVVRVGDTHYMIIVTNVLLYLNVWRLERNVQAVIIHLGEDRTPNKVALLYTTDIIPDPPIYCLLHLEHTVYVIKKIQLAVVVTILQTIVSIHTSRILVVI